MKQQPLSNQEVLELLRRCHSAELPPGVELQLREEFARIRGRFGADRDVQSSAAAIRSPQGPVWTGWRVAAALAALVLAILGATLRPAGAAGTFKAPLELWQQRARVLSNLGRVVVMESRVEGRDGTGSPFAGLVRWRAGEPVSIEGPGAGEPARRALNAAGLPLHPRELARALDGAWRVGSVRGADAAREFVVLPPGGSREVLLTIDPASNLPVSVADPNGGLVVHFRWTVRSRGASVLLSGAGRQ